MSKRVFFLFLLVGIMQGKIYAQSNQQLLEDGIRALQTSNFARARQSFALLVKRNPSGRNFGYLAIAEASSGDLHQAIEHFREAIRLGNDSAHVHYNLGLAYLQGHQPSAAIRELRLAAAKDSQFLPAQDGLAVALMDAGRAKEAVTYFERERSRSPKNPETWANLVQAQFAAGQADAALRSVDKAAEAIPNNVQLAILLANVCLNYKQPQKARYLVENASELAPHDNNVKLLLSKASLASGEPVEAVAVLKDVPENAGKAGQLSFLRGVALGRVGKLEEAAKQLSAAIAADPQNGDYLITYAWLQQLGGYYQEALTTLDKARKLKSHTALIPYASAVSYFFLHRFPQSAESCEEAIHLEPSYAPSYLLLGMTELKQGNLRAAETALRQGLALQPKLPFFHRELGVALFKGGDLKGSKKELDEALSLDPKDARAYFWRAQVLASQGQPREAAAELETAVAIEPAYSSAYDELAQVYRAAGEPQKAAQALMKRETMKDSEAEEDRGLFLQQLYNALP